MIGFLQDNRTPEPFREGIAIALDGPMDRSRLTGYKVIFFPWQGGRPGRQIDLKVGWLDDQSELLGTAGRCQACQRRLSADLG
jgi:hypothetical protein